MSLAVAPASATTAAMLITISEFSSRRDNRPRSSRMPWETLVDRLAKHATRREKDGPGWSPTVYDDGAKRSKKGVLFVTALVLDIDHREPPRGLLDGLAWCAHTTFSHTVTDPRWRLIIQLARPVRAEDWLQTWLRAQRHFGAAADEACKDASRFFYWPSRLPGADCHVERHDGDPLDVDDLPALSEPSRAPQPAATAARTTSTKPYVDKALADELDAVAAASPGQRNPQLNKSSFALGQFVGAGELNRNDVEAQLELAAERNGLVVDDGVDQVRRTIASGLDAGAAQPRIIPPPSPLLRIARPHTNGTANGKVDHPPPVPPDEPSAARREPPSSQPHTELWSAEQYVKLFGDQLRYCGESGWLFYRSGVWTDDRTGHPMRFAKRMVRQWLRDAASAGETDEGLAKWAIKCHAQAKLDSILRGAQTEARVAISITDFDQQPLLLNAKNCTVNLRTGEAQPHRAEDLLTKQCPVDFDASAECPRWERFLAEVFDDDQVLIRYLQRLLGHSMTGLQLYHLLVFLWGAGRNGKTTMLEVIAKVLGDYAKSVSSELLLASRENSDYNVAQLRGVRLAITSETGQHRRLDEARVKLLTGGDTLPARHPYGRPFTFAPTHHVWLSSNHKPEIQGQDNGIWARVKLIEFPNRFELPLEGTDAKTWQHGPHTRLADPSLAERLEAERTGILAWLVRGAVEALRDGLREPASVSAATERYREQMDVLGGFLDDCCDVGPYLSDTSSRLYGAYKGWCANNGVEPVASNKFGMLLADRGSFVMVKLTTGDRLRRWSGLQVRASGATDDDR